MIYESTARNITGGHIVRAPEEIGCTVIVTNGSAESRVAAYGLLTRDERTELARTLGGTAAVLSWLYEDGYANEALDLLPERRQHERRQHERRSA